MAYFSVRRTPNISHSTELGGNIVDRPHIREQIGARELIAHCTNPPGTLLSKMHLGHGSFVKSMSPKLSIVYVAGLVSLMKNQVRKLGKGDKNLLRLNRRFPLVG